MAVGSVDNSCLGVAEPGEVYGGQENSQSDRVTWVEVLVDCPGAVGLFTYRAAASLAVEPGDILSVPFGAQIVGGIAIRLLPTQPVDIPLDKIRNVEDIASKAFFPRTYWQLLNRVATYYYTPLIQVVRCALPPGLLGRSQRRIRLVRTVSASETQFLSRQAQQILALLQAAPSQEYSFVYLQRQVRNAYRGVHELKRSGLIESYVQAPRLSRPKLQKAVTLTVNNNPIDLTNRQREIIEMLRRRGGEMWQGELLQACSASSGILKNLADKGYIVIEEREVLRYEAATISPQLQGESTKQLTPAQTQVLETINRVTGYATMLLHGVTGSGKTEVYLQAIAPVLNRGKSALVLVPEIGLTPQLTDRFRARFGDKIRVYHSALSDGERYDTWREMLAGEALVVIGTRSAVFSPLPNLELIILDEEHDTSFKQETPTPTYHARTVAQWRAELENCRLLLGSATPALETWLDAQSSNQGNYYYLSLPERVNARPLPPIEVVDMRSELHQGNKSIFSRSLLRALRELQANQQQGILFIHRRGHSSFVSCRSCGYVMECPHCDVSLAYHHTEEGAAKLLRCHYCNFTQLHPPHCPECGSPYFKFFGSGTQRVAQELAKILPELRVIRYDSDTTRTKGSHRTLLTQFANGEADILLGTQMLTKGLDLPQVTLVGIIAADGLLHMCDYRASERAFQTLTQVAGRAGRSENAGKVILQTYTTEHPVIAAVAEMPQAQAAHQSNYETFIRTELSQRHELNYPPYGRLILLRLTSIDPIQVQNTANIIATALAGKPGYEILGPAPASILRVANRYRWQILLKFDSHNLPEIPNWEGIRNLCHPSVSLTIDVDPMTM